MADKITNIKERILEIPTVKGISKEKFFEKIGMSYGSFKGKSKKTPINSNALADIITNYPDINIEWLITGKGEMLLSEKENEVFQTLGEEQHEYNADQNENEVNVKIILEVNGNTKERILKLLGSNPDLDFLK